MVCRMFGITLECSLLVIRRLRRFSYRWTAHVTMSLFMTRRVVYSLTLKGVN